MSVAWTAYRLLAPCLGALAPAAKMFASADERPLWGERLGEVGREERCDAWVHAASLGEARAVEPLVRELQALQPGARLHLTSSTRAGRARLGSLEQPFSLAPIDSPQAVKRFFDRVRPSRLVLVETELWPHWLLRARDQEVPVAVVSARLSERSVRRYRGLGGGLRGLVAGISAVVCQGPADERRWLAVGARPERTAVAGNLKDDALPRPAPSRRAARAEFGLEPERPLLVLGSVRPGEVRILARAWQALPAVIRERWQVAAVARHARASRDLRDEAARAGQPLVLEGAPRSGAWRWDDRPGVLLHYYAAADVAFVGGSLLPYGGHNPIEPAACGAAVIIGPHHEAQAEGVRALAAREAAWITPAPAELAAALLALLEDEALRTARGEAGRAAIETRRGAARRAVARLAAWGLWPVD